MSIFNLYIFVEMSLSSVAQWQSNRLLTDRSLVRIQPGEPDIPNLRTLTLFVGFFISAQFASIRLSATYWILGIRIKLLSVIA